MAEDSAPKGYDLNKKISCSYLSNMSQKLTAHIPSGTLHLAVDHTDLPLSDICAYASRQNPKRAFLFVSKVLGKHYPVKPRLMHEVYKRLGHKLKGTLNPEKDRALCLGFAETATGLGAGVYEQIQNFGSTTKEGPPHIFIHTTRYHLEEQKTLFHFQEEHSHATGHIVYQPQQANFNLGNYNTLILIDDEITTGKTLQNFIEQIQRLPTYAIKKIIIVSIKNWMDRECENRLTSYFKETPIHFVQILRGTYEFKANPAHKCESMPAVEGSREDKAPLLIKNWGRIGLEYLPCSALGEDIERGGKNIGAKLSFSDIFSQIDLHKKTLVLGTGEFAYPPYLLARELEKMGVDVRYQSTTRSPVLLGADIQYKINFKDNYGDNIDNFLYNVAPDGMYEQILVCYETYNSIHTELHAQLKNAKAIFL